MIPTVPVHCAQSRGLDPTYNVRLFAIIAVAAVTLKSMGITNGANLSADQQNLPSVGRMGLSTLQCPVFLGPEALDGSYAFPLYMGGHQDVGNCLNKKRSSPPFGTPHLWTP